MALSNAFFSSIKIALLAGTLILLVCFLVWLIGRFLGCKDKISGTNRNGRYLIFFLPTFYLGVFSIIFPAMASKAGINPILAFVISFCLCVALIIGCSKIHERFYPGDYQKIES